MDPIDKLEVEELEERIAPHFLPLGGNAAVGAQVHGDHAMLSLPNGTTLHMPEASAGGLGNAS